MPNWTAAYQQRTAVKLRQSEFKSHTAHMRCWRTTLPQAKTWKSPVYIYTYVRIIICADLCVYVCAFVCVRDYYCLLIIVLQVTSFQVHATIVAAIFFSFPHFNSHILIVHPEILSLTQHNLVIIQFPIYHHCGHFFSSHFDCKP